MPKPVKIFIIAIGAVAAVFFLTRSQSVLAPQTSRPSVTGEARPEGAATLFFAGDIMLSRNVADKMAKAQDFTLPFQKTATVTRAADIAFANLESPFNDKGAHFVPNSLVFNADPQAIAGLNFAGFDVLSTANNHSFDQGTTGIEFTYNWLKNHGILPVGTGLPNVDPTLGVIKKNNINFGFLAYSYSAHNDGGKSVSPYIGDFHNLTQLKQDILTLKGHYSDLVIVSMHAGTEYTRTPNQQQIDFAHAAIDAGADLVIGAHPHWIQTIEQYKGKWIFYSLGNFVFDQMWSQETREGLTLKITLEQTEIKKIELMPVIIDDYSTPRWANSDETTAILGKLGLTSGIILVQN